ncbi:hypothetical protein [Methanoregula sp.]|jgi:hypothetical protein
MNGNNAGLSHDTGAGGPVRFQVSGRIPRVYRAHVVMKGREA